MIGIGPAPTWARVARDLAVISCVVEKRRPSLEWECAYCGGVHRALALGTISPPLGGLVKLPGAFVYLATANTAPVAVVTEGNKISLGDKLDLKNLPLATTPGGKSFAMKSLHPSDHVIKNTRVPGRTVPSTALTCDIIQTIPIPSNVKYAVLYQTPNPLILGSLLFFDADETVTKAYWITNSALGADGINEVTSNWSGVFNDTFNVNVQNLESYTVTAQSMTVEYVAPKLAEQGTITSSQFELKPKTVDTCTMYLTGDTIDSFNIGSDVWVYEYPPQSDILLMATSAYTSDISKGVYQPLKLGKFKTCSFNDGMVPLTVAGVQSNQTVAYDLTAPATLFPYYVPFKPGKSKHNIPKPSSSIVGVTYFEGFDAANYSVSLRIRARQCLDVIPKLGGTYAPMAVAPLPPDETSMRMVREVAGRMMDAYPASYNDLGKLKDVISKIGSAVLKYADPALDFISNFIPGANLAALPLKIAGGLMSNAGKKQATYVPPTVDAAAMRKAADVAIQRSSQQNSAPMQSLQTPAGRVIQHIQEMPAPTQRAVQTVPKNYQSPIYDANLDIRERKPRLQQSAVFPPRLQQVAYVPARKAMTVPAPVQVGRRRRYKYNVFVPPIIHPKGNIAPIVARLNASIGKKKKKSRRRKSKKNQKK